MRLAVLKLVCLAAALLCGSGTPAWAKSKKSKKTPPATATETPEPPRVLLYDAAHPTSAPGVLLGDAPPAKIPDVPLLNVTMTSEPENASVAEKSVTLDQEKAKSDKKSKKKAKKKADDADD